MVIFIEACQSGSMLEGLPADINIYGVTAVRSDGYSLAVYLNTDASINGTLVGTSALGDLFAVYLMKFVSEGNGTRTLDQLYRSVYDDTASYAALHYDRELNQRFGNLTMGELTVGDFFYGESDVELAATFVRPTSVKSAVSVDMEHHQFKYSEAAAQPLSHGVGHWLAMVKATADLQTALDEQKATQQLYWTLVDWVYPANKEMQVEIWTRMDRPLNPQCELEVRKALLDSCGSKMDLTKSYATQFHQIVVNLCGAQDLGWNVNPSKGASLARLACSSIVV